MTTIHEDLKAYLDGELSPERTAEVEAAIAGDPALQDEVNAMKQIGSMLRNLAEARTIPVRGADKALGTTRRRFSPMRLAPWVASLAVIALVAVIGPKLIGGSMAPASEAVGAANMKLPAPATTMPAEAPMAKVAGRAGDFAGGESMGEVGNSAAQGGVPPLAFPQLLVRTGEISLRVEDAAKAQKQVIDLATSLGGFVSSSNISRDQFSNPTGYVTFRVPVKRFEGAFERLRGMGEVVSESSNTEDVTAQVADMEARLKVMRAEEDSYVTMLRAARKVGEMLEIKERLSAVRQQIESIDSQRKAMRDQATYSTINCTIMQRPRVGEPKKSDEWANDAWSNAVNGLQSMGRNLGRFAINVFVFAPVWLPILFVGWLLARWAGRPRA